MDNLNERPVNPGNPMTFAGVEINLAQDAPAGDSKGLLSLEDDEPVAQDQIDLTDVPTGSVPVSPEVAAERAAKVHFGLGERSPGIETLQSAIANGTEDDIRSMVAAESNVARYREKVSLVDQLSREGADMATILGVAQLPVETDPNAIFEEEFGSRAATAALVKGTQNPSSEVAKELSTNPEAVLDSSNALASLLAKREGFNRLQENIKARIEEQSWGGYLADVGATLLPLWSAYRMRNLVREAPTGTILPGQNLQAQMEYLWSLPTGEALKQAKAAVEELAANNLQQAREFAELLTTFSTSRAQLDNIFGALDVATLPGLGAAGRALKGAKSAVSEAQASKKFMRDVAEAVAEPNPKVENIVAATGDVAKAGEMRALKELTEGLKKQDQFGHSVDLRSEIPSLFRPDIVTGRAGDFSREFAERLKIQMASNSEELMKALTLPGSVDRLPEEALMAAAKQAREDMKAIYNRASDAIIDFGFVRPEYSLAKVGTVEMKLGKPDATLFDNAAQAYHYAKEQYKIPDEAYRINQQGAGYYISVFKNIDETSDPARAAILTTDNTAKTGLLNTFLGGLRSAQDILPAFQQKNRHLVSHAQSIVHQYMNNVAQDIRSLPKQSLKDLERVLIVNRDAENIAQNSRGMFFENLEELSTMWRTITGKPPTEAEAKAYFSYVQMSDFDWMARNLAIHRDKARIGIERIKVGFRTPDREADGQVWKGSRIQSAPFDGKLLKELPWGTDWEKTANANIFFHNGKDGGTVLAKRGMSYEQRRELEQAIASGEYKLIQVANPLDKPFSGGKTVQEFTGTDDVVHFIIAKDVETSPLPWKQIDYKPGGHVEYVYDHWVKQPRIRRVYRDGESEEAGNAALRHLYEGDRTVLNFASEAEARDYVARMNTARVMYAENRLDELAEYLPKNLPWSVKEFESFFRPDPKSGERMWHPNDAFEYTRGGTTSVDLNKAIPTKYTDFEDSIRSPYNLYQQINKEYAGQRDATAWSIKNTGTDENPAFKLIDTRLMDPLETMNRAMSNIMRGRFMDDYKTSAVDQFIAQFGHLLKDVTPEQLKANPMFYLHNPVWDERLGDQALLAQAKNTQRAVVGLLGQETPMQRKINGVKNALLDFTYEKLGMKAYDTASEAALANVSNPIDFLKQTAFHTKLGLFNPMQVILQAMTMVHTVGVAGLKNGLPGVAAGSMLYRLGKNESPEVLSHIANAAGKMGYDKKHFIEAALEVRKTGWLNIGGEHAWKSDALDPKLFQGKVGTFLDKGTFFFNEGEKLSRASAWMTAYREWRVANPGKAMDNSSRNEVLNRANILTNNMTNASNAAWQQGIWSVPTQFLAYNARMTEALFPFLSNRLTTAEKTRATATYMALFGIPTTLGGVAGVWPIGEEIRKAAMERGYNLEAPAAEAFFNGAAGWAINTLAGREWNFSERFGINGSSFIKDLVTGDKKLIEMAMGPSGSIVGDWLKTSEPLVRRGLAAFGNDKNEGFKLYPADFLDMGRNISSVNSATRMIMAINVGKFLSKNDAYQTDATPWEAVFSAIAGVNPRDITDANMIVQSLKATKDAQNEAQRMVSINVRRAMEAQQRGDETAYDDYMKRANIYLVAGGFRPDQMAQVWMSALDNSTSQANKAQRDFIKNAPATQYKDRYDRQLNRLEQNN